MRLAALALLFFISSQAVCATHILAGKALVKGLANILNELPGNATQKASAGVPANFSIGASSGNLFCFPRYYAKEIETPSLMCPDGYSANGTTALAGIACIKQSYVQKQNCFRSMQCPANGQNMVADELCMPSEVRSALIGMLVVFKVKAMLPFTILPLLKTALVKAVTFPIILPAKLIGAKVATGAMLANAVLNQTAGGIGGMDLAGMGGFGGFKNKNNSLLELLGQLEALKPNPAALLAAKFNQSDSMGVGTTAGSSFGGSAAAAAADTDLGLLLAAAQLAALQKFSNQSSGGSVFGSMPASSGSTFTFGGLSDKDAQLTLLISQLAQLQAFNKTGMPILGASNMRMAAANTFSGGLFDKNSSSSSSSGILQLVEALKPNAVAMLASLIGSGSTGGFTGFADKGNASSVLQLVAQLEALKPNPTALLAALTDKNSTMQLIEQLAQMPVFNPAGALAALGLGGIMNKNTTLPQLIAQLEALKPNPAALLAGLIGGSGAGEFGGFGDKNASLPLLLQLALQKPNPLAAREALGGSFGDKNGSLPLPLQLALQKPNPLAALEALGGMGGSAFGDKNGTLPLLLQLALQKPNPLAVLEALSGGLGDKNGSLAGLEALSGMGGSAFGDKNGSLPLLLQLALQKPNPLAALEALGGMGGSTFGDKNGSLPLLLQLALQKPNPLAVLEALGGSFTDKNGSLPLPMQLALQKPNPLAILEALGGGLGDKNGSLPLLLQLALQKPNPLAVLEALGDSLGDKNGSLPLPLQLALQKFNMSMLDIPGFSMGSMTVMPELSITLGGGNMSSIFPASLVRQAASLTFAGGDVVGALMKGADPMELFTGSLLNINVNEIMNFLPQVNSWVSEHLQNLTHVNEITAQISANFPDCIYRCCKNEQTLDTSIALPTPTCNPGLKFNPITKLCVGASAGYANCPSYMNKCPASLPNGQPICVAETDSFGLDTCKVLVLAQHTLPQHQCPA
ncbi:hypothetical protein OEZ85_009497 [Tetradesmus obliquus]|uniref:Chitin-binding type-2 domain-containing protein n=1 Tax=Tetradesmus obliquus TaxID=3088 RepID=A0ABY8U9G8_TETOB|nr:hypothetical protein OEZ85_009497 [Tetradesmus obliquus]